MTRHRTLAHALFALALGALTTGLVACTVQTQEPPPAPVPVTAPAATTTPPPVVEPPPVTTSRAAPKTTQAKAKIVYTCEPNATAKFGDPAHPNTITNKSCPAANAAKEKAAREYQQQQAKQINDAALAACRAQTGQTNAQCIAQAARGEAS